MKNMKKKTILIAVIFCIIIIIIGTFFIKPPLKTVDVTSGVYEEKIQFKGMYFLPETIIYSGELKGMKLKYSNGEKVAKDSVIALGVTARDEGILRIGLDGYENVYNLNNIKNISESDIDKMIDNTKYKDGIKTINNAEWYICAHIKEDLRLKKGRKKEIQISNIDYKAQAIDMFKDKSGIYIIFKLRDDLNIFNLHRGFKGYIIKSRYEGFVLSKESVVNYEGNVGVFVHTNGYVEFKKINVLYKGDKIVASDENSSSRYLQEYDKIICNPENIRKSSIIE